MVRFNSKCVLVVKDVGTSFWATSSVTRLGNLLDFGQISKPLAKINLPKSPSFSGHFCEEIFNFSSEIIFGQLLYTFGDFFLVTLAIVRKVTD